MTASSRPNLGGLFNGTQPPNRPGKVNGVVGPKLVATPPPVAQPATTTEATATGPTAPTEPQSGNSRVWADPVKVVEQYFALLQTLLVVNRDVAVACTRAVLSLPHRVGIRR